MRLLVSFRYRDDWSLKITTIFCVIILLSARRRKHGAGGLGATAATTEICRRIGRPYWLNNDNSKVALDVSGLMAKRGRCPEMNNLHFTSSQWSAVMQLAQRDIKADKQCILDGYEFRIKDHDTEFEASKGMKILFDTMSNKEPHLALFGAGCTSVNEPVAMTAKYFEMVQVSYSESHPKFTSDKSTFNLFYSVIPAFRNINLARVRLLNHFKWKRVSIVVQRDDARYAIPQEEVQSALEKKHDIKVEVSVGFSGTRSNIQKELFNFNAKKRDPRIILGFFNSSVAAEIFCEAWHQNLTGTKYVWIISDLVDENWWRTSPSNCSMSDLLTILNGHFMLSFSVLRSDKRITRNGKNAEQFREEFLKICTTSECKKFKYHGYIYDAVWTLALALENSVSELSTRYNNKFDTSRWNQQKQEEWREIMLESLNVTNFEGVTGTVRFDGNQRLGLIKILFFKNESYINIGEYDAVSERFFINNLSDCWPGGNVPADGMHERPEKRYIDFAVFCIMSVLTAIGIFVAVWFLVVNIYFRNHRFIKMSSPNMNNMIVAGSILTYFSVILIGLDTRMVSKEVFGIICTAKVWTLCLGFTLAFGSMFSKTWRVHSIFTNIKLNKKAIKDYKLFLIVFVLLLIDLIILTVWLITDRMSHDEKSLEKVIFHEENLQITPKIEFCKSGNTEIFKIFQGLIFGFKGLLLISGCFLAWETRHVNVPALNDSKYIGACVYNVVVMCSLGVPISFILEDNINASYILISIFIIFCTTLTLFLVFIPKVIELVRNPKGGPPDRRFRTTMMRTSMSAGGQNMGSSGSVEDKKERLLRTEQDNQVWKKLFEERSAELSVLIKQLEDTGEKMSSEKMSNNAIAKRRPTVIDDDPFGGVFLGFNPSSELAKKEEGVLVSPVTPQNDEVTETTSLLRRNGQNSTRENKRSTTTRPPSVKRLPKDKSINNSMDSSDQGTSTYQSLADIEEIDLPAVPMNHHVRNQQKPNSVITPLTKLKYMEPLLQDECMTTSQTMPSMKDNCFGNFNNGQRFNKRSSSNMSYESAYSRVAETVDEYESALSSAGSFFYANLFDDCLATFWDAAAADAADSPSRPSTGRNQSTTEETWLTPTEEDTVTWPMDDYSSDTQMLLTEGGDTSYHPTGSGTFGSGTMSTSSSIQSVGQFNRRQHEKAQQREVAGQGSAKSKMTGWFEKLTSKVIASPEEATSSRGGYGRIPRLDSRPVPKHLLEHSGPECPFVARTKDFELYSKFTMDKIVDEESE